MLEMGMEVRPTNSSTRGILSEERTWRPMLQQRPWLRLSRLQESIPAMMEVMEEEEEEEDRKHHQSGVVTIPSLCISHRRITM